MKKHSKKNLKKKLRKARKKLHNKKKNTGQCNKHDLTLAMEDEPMRDSMSQLDSVQIINEEVSLSYAKTQWLFGEWDELLKLDMSALSSHPERDKFALLVASAYQQLGDHDKARTFSRLALEWDCDQRIVAQVLIAGIHNTLGRAASLKKDEIRQTRHFGAAVKAIGAKDEGLISNTRAIRELSRMGMLPQAAALVTQQIKSLPRKDEQQQKQEQRIKILKTEIELLNHELSLAQQRNQFFSRKDKTKINHYKDVNDTLSLNEKIKKLSVSQLGQDVWVLEKTEFKKNGYFVEFGATDGVLLNNTYLLEKEFLWTGICAEPNPLFLSKLKNNRECLISEQCIGGKTGEKVEFIFADAFGGMSRYSSTDMHAEKRDAYKNIGEFTMIETISLDDFLIQHNAPKKIDYLSIDTEGSEYEILSTFPFEKWDVHLVTVEHNYTPHREKIRNLMEENGYLCTPKEWDDWYEKKTN